MPSAVLAERPHPEAKASVVFDMWYAKHMENVVEVSEYVLTRYVPAEDWLTEQMLRILVRSARREKEDYDIRVLHTATYFATLEESPFDSYYLISIKPRNTDGNC